jgi:hypothetical protein
MTIACLIDYLQQFQPTTRVVLSEDAIEYPGDYVSLSALSFDDEEVDSTPAQQEIFPGYFVEKLEETGDVCFAYQITGPRGKTWRLMRNKPNPAMLFPVPETISKGALAIRGHKWFTDRNGTLEAL